MYPTNAIGIMDALNGLKFNIAGKKALVIGTGRGVHSQLAVGRIGRRGRPRQSKNLPSGRSFQLHAEVAEESGRLSHRRRSNCQCTSISSRDESSELTDIAGSLKSNGCQLVFDLNYGHRENIWQTLAEKSGIRFMDGLPALAYQARRTFLLWTGQDVFQEEFFRRWSPEQLTPSFF